MKGYIIIENQEDKEVITGWHKTLKDAQKEARDGERVYEVSGAWEARPLMELDKESLEDIFG